MEKSFLEVQAEDLEARARAIEAAVAKARAPREAEILGCWARAFKHGAECFRSALANKALPRVLDNVFFDLIGEVDGRAEGALEQAQADIVARSRFFDLVSHYPPPDGDDTLREVAIRLRRAAGAVE